MSSGSVSIFSSTFSFFPNIKLFSKFFFSPSWLCWCHVWVIRDCPGQLSSLTSNGLHRPGRGARQCRHHGQRIRLSSVSSGLREPRLPCMTQEGQSENCQMLEFQSGMVMAKDRFDTSESTKKQDIACDPRAVGLWWIPSYLLHIYGHTCFHTQTCF